MIASLFDVLNSIAHYIGWGAMILGVLWIVTRIIQEKRDYRDAIADRDAMFKFEIWLQDENPDRFRRYRDIKDLKALEEAQGSGGIHWCVAAKDAGVPTSDIFKRR